MMYKVNEGRPNVADHLVNRDIDMVINTPLGRDSFFDDLRGAARGDDGAGAVHHDAHGRIGGGERHQVAAVAYAHPCGRCRTTTPERRRGRGRPMRAPGAKAPGSRLQAPGRRRRPGPASLAVLLLAAGVALSGQTFRSRVVTVPVTATVVDAQGRLVRGLTRDDFQVFEDGVEQPVTQFTDERVPVSLGLLLDASDSMRGQADARRERGGGTLRRRSAQGGGRGLHRLFNHRPRLAASWTRPASALKLRLGTVVAGGGTAIYDAVVQAAPFFDRRARPRAALVVISDGADTASDRTLQQAREAVVRRDAFVYAVAIDEVDAQASTRVNPAALSDLTSPTGGYTEVVRVRRGAGTSHRAHRRRAELAIHDRLQSVASPPTAPGAASACA